MRSPVKSEHWNDANGNPAGGSTFGNGFAISWQNGPLGRHTPDCVPSMTPDAQGTCAPGCTRRDPNGAFVEDIIHAAVTRLEFYQASKFKCEENQFALFHLNKALALLNQRTLEREARAVEGTHAK